MNKTTENFRRKMKQPLQFAHESGRLSQQKTMPVGKSRSAVNSTRQKKPIKKDVAASSTEQSDSQRVKAPKKKKDSIAVTETKGMRLSPTRQRKMAELQPSPENPSAFIAQLQSKKNDMVEWNYVTPNKCRSSVKVTGRRTNQGQLFEKLSKEIRQEASDSGCDPSLTPWQQVIVARNQSPNRQFNNTSNEQQLSFLDKMQEETSSPQSKKCAELSAYSLLQSGEARSQSMQQLLNEYQVDLVQQILDRDQKRQVKSSTRQQPRQMNELYSMLAETLKNKNKKTIESFQREAPEEMPVAYVSLARSKTQLQVGERNEEFSNVSWPSQQLKMPMTIISPQNNHHFSSNQRLTAKADHWQDLSQVSIRSRLNGTPTPQALDSHRSQSNSRLHEYKIKPVQPIAQPTAQPSASALLRYYQQKFNLPAQVQQFSPHSEQSLWKKTQQKQDAHDQQQMNQVLLHHAASTVQKYLRGTVARLRLRKGEFRFFAMARRVRNRAFGKEVVQALRDSYVYRQLTWQLLQKAHVNRSASLIQALFRGYLARVKVVPLQRKVARFRRMLFPLVIGWRLRRIFRTKEVHNRIQQIRDFQKEENENSNELMGLRQSNQNNTPQFKQQKRQLEDMIVALKHSRLNTISKLTNLMRKMAEKGLWLTYKQLEKDKGVKKFVPSRFKDESPRRLEWTKHEFASSEVKSAIVVKRKEPENVSAPAKPVLGNYERRQNPHMMANTRSVQNLVSPSPKPLAWEPKQQKLEDTPPQKRTASLYNSTCLVHSQSLSRVTTRTNGLQNNLAKYNVENNRQVQPNFNSTAYQAEAKEIFKRRMKYDPREAAKQHKRIDKSKVESEYSATRLSQSKSTSQMNFGYTQRKPESQYDILQNKLVMQVMNTMKRLDNESPAPKKEFPRETSQNALLSRSATLPAYQMRSSRITESQNSYRAPQRVTEEKERRERSQNSTQHITYGKVSEIWKKQKNEEIPEPRRDILVQPQKRVILADEPKPIESFRPVNLTVAPTQEMKIEPAQVLTTTSKQLEQIDETPLQNLAVKKQRSEATIAHNFAMSTRNFRQNPAKLSQETASDAKQQPGTDAPFPCSTADLLQRLRTNSHIQKTTTDTTIQTYQKRRTRDERKQPTKAEVNSEIHMFSVGNKPSSLFKKQQTNAVQQQQWRF